MTQQRGIVERTKRGLNLLLSEIAGDGRDIKATGRSLSPPESPHPLETEQIFRARLAELASTLPALSGGRIRVITLDEVRNRLGERWSSLSLKIETVVRRAIERRLVSADLYTRLDELHYFIVFSDDDFDGARLKCALIDDEIRRALIGDPTQPASVLSQVDFVPLDGRGGIRQLLDTISSDFQALAQSSSALDRASLPDAGYVDATAPVPPHFVYRPMWDTQRNVITTYVLVPALATKRSTLVVGEAAVSAIADPGAALEFDLLALKRVATDLDKLAKSNRKLLIIAPVHFETLAAASRRVAYIRQCEALAPSMRQLTIFELIAVPEGVPQGRLLDLTLSLKSYSRAIVLRVPLSQTSFRLAVETGVMAVGVDISDRRSRENRILEAMPRFVEAANKAGFQTYIHGVDSFSLATSAVAAGFDYINGEVVAAIDEDSMNAIRYDSRDMLGPILL